MEENKVKFWDLAMQMMQYLTQYQDCALDTQQRAQALWSYIRINVSRMLVNPNPPKIHSETQFQVWHHLCKDHFNDLWLQFDRPGLVRPQSPVKRPHLEVETGVTNSQTEEEAELVAVFSLEFFLSVLPSVMRLFCKYWG